MSAAALAAIIATISCADPPLTFRNFYASYYVSTGPGQSWMGFRSEAISSVVERVMESTADFADYRAAYADKCGRGR